MKKRRIGNDFHVTWEIKENGEPVDLIEVKDSIELFCNTKERSVKVPKELIEPLADGLIRVEIKTEVFNQLGRNEFVLKYIHPDETMSDGDRKIEYDFTPFFLVAKSELADKNEDVVGAGDILLGLKGDKGDPFTYEDFTPEQIEDLKRPAIEAAENANTAAQNANDARGNIMPSVLNNEEVQADVYAQLNARITALEAILTNKIKDRVDVTKEFNVYGKTNLILYGNGASTKTPDFIGQTYIDTTGAKVYIAVGVSNAGNWKLV